MNQPNAAVAPLFEKLIKVRERRAAIIAEANAIAAEMQRLQGKLNEANAQIFTCNGAEAQLADLIAETGAPVPPATAAVPPKGVAAVEPIRRKGGGRRR